MTATMVKPGQYQDKEHDSKQELRLRKNRESAQASRQKKKEYVEQLEKTIRELTQMDPELFKCIGRLERLVRDTMNIAAVEDINYIKQNVNCSYYDILDLLNQLANVKTENAILKEKVNQYTLAIEQSQSYIKDLEDYATDIELENNNLTNAFVNIVTSSLFPAFKKEEELIDIC